MRSILAAFVAGALFGLGLTVSQMIDPGKVQGFLDLAGDWDPSLALVMGGALAVAAPAFAWARRLPAPMLERRFHLSALTAIDARLLGGAALFGIGWGLSGFCPGPAISALSFGLGQVWPFVLAMLVGLALPALLERLGRPATA